MTTASTASAPRMKHYRERMRASGLRPIQLWVPDTRSPGFAEECRRQSAALSHDPTDAAAADFVAAAAAWAE